MGQLMSQNQTQGGDGEQQTSFWYRMLLKAVAMVAGVLAMALGIFACVSLHARCIASGILMFLAGAIVTVLEAPCCCQFIEFANKLSEFSEKRPAWQKAIFYFVLPIPSLAMCFSVSTFFAAAMIIVTGALYGLQVIGKKAPREEMVMRATMSQSGNMQASLVSSEQPPGYSDAPPTQTLPTNSGMTGTVNLTATVNPNDIATALPPKAIP